MGTICSPRLVCAIDGTWSANSSGSWSGGTNWSTNPSVPNGIGDTARFLTAITAPRSIGQNVVGLKLGQIQFSGSHSYTISGNSITLDASAGNATVTGNTTGGSAAHLLGTDLVLTDSVTVTTNASSTFPLTFTGAISGSGGLVKSGPGYLLLQGGFPNTFSGVAVVNEGTLDMFKTVASRTSIGGDLVVGDGVGGANADIAITKNSAIPDTANVQINPSGQLQVSSADVFNNLSMTGGSVTISGGGPFLGVLGSVTTNAHASEAAINGTGQVRIPIGGVVNVADGTALNDLHISAQIQEGGILKQGAGTLVLSANNTNGSTTTISAGILQFGNGGLTGLPGPGEITNNAMLSFNRSDSFNFANNISGIGGAQNVGSGTTNLTGGVSCTGPMAANAGKLVLNHSMVNTSSVQCTGNGVVELASNGTATRVMKVGTVTTIATGKLDVGDNKLIVTGQPIGSWNGAAYTGVTGLVQSGRGDGSWNGSGIVTSMTDATTSVLTTLATATAQECGYAGGTFAGISVTASDVLVMYTWGGDADLNGQLNGDDYFYLDSNILQNGSVFGFHNGDYNYDGSLNGDDYFILDSNILQAQASGYVFPTGAGGLTSVPEPSLAVSLLAVGGAISAMRRRRANPL